MSRATHGASRAVVAALGDAYGRLTLAYRLLRPWHTESGERLHVIPQVGDLGEFPPSSRLDAAMVASVSTLRGDES